MTGVQTYALPIYDTAYYINPNSGSQVSGSRFYFGSHGSVYDDGNFHIDGHSSPIWINSLSNSTIELNTQTSGYTNIGNSARSPIFYDSNDTNYYCDPNSNSRFNNIYNSYVRSYGDIRADSYVYAAGRVVVGEGAASSWIEMRDTDEGTKIGIAHV